MQLNPDAGPSANPSNPWAISVDGEQVQYEIAYNALSVNPETTSQITLLTILDCFYSIFAGSFGHI